MTSPLSIGLVSPGWPPASHANGIVTYVASVAPRLRALGHEVSILTHADGAPVEPGIYDMSLVQANRTLPRRAADWLWYRAHPRSAIRGFACRGMVRTARRMAAERSLDVLEMEESFGFAAHIRAAIRRPVIVRLHGPWFLTGQVADAGDPVAFRWRVEQERRAIAAADLVTAPAHDVLRRVREFYRLPLHGAEVVPNPVEPIARGERWTLDGCDPARVLFVGRFEHLKGGDLVVDAFARVLAAAPQARLCFVGPDVGVTAADGRRFTLEQYVRERVPGALEAGRIELLGRQPFSALAALRRSAMVSVVCSRYENFPYTAIESMALGCPVVAAQVGGVPEIVRHGENGLLHRGGDAADLADRILEVLAAPRRAAELGLRAAEDCERLLHPEVVARRLVGLYEQVAATGVAVRAPEPSRG